MAQTQVYEGTPAQSEGNSAPNEPSKRITFGMFPQLLALGDEDIKCAEWRGEDN